MDFLIADTFTDSLAKLTGEEQKAVKTAAFDLQLNPVSLRSASAGLSLHKIDRAKDKNFWSARVSSDLRLIVHRTANRLVLCYAAHHDPAYRWAEGRKLETHPKTGAAQFVEIREQVQEIFIPKYVEVEQPAPPKPGLFTHLTDETLLGYGVPPEWLNDVRQCDEDSLLALADHLPGEAADALLELATGGKPRLTEPVVSIPDPFAHPDAQRRFRIIGDVEELERALAYPWDKWITFLHPAQRQWVERDYTGPARVAGSAGTGKTIVALHRAVFLARTQPESRVLLTTFSRTLANALRLKLNRLISNTPRLAERLEVHDLNSIGARLYERHFGKPHLASRETIAAIIAEAAAGQKFSRNFLLSEWDELVDAWQLDSWEAYRDVQRLGRKTRLSEAQRAAAWSVFAAVRARLAADGLITLSGMFSQLAARLAEGRQSPFDCVVVDEAQDVGVAQLRFLAALGGERPNGLFFAGDLGQRIFQPPFSWKALGVDVRGRSRTLHINYRTSHQIRQQADRLLGPELADVDGNREDRRGTVSVFNGPAPLIQTFNSQEDEISAVSAWLVERNKEGVAPHEIGVFVRSEAELSRARAAVGQAGLAFTVLNDQMETITGQVALSPMHLAKGLEFRAVVVMACDDEIVPLQARIETVSDDSDLEEVYNTERHLLYVACTRARDHLLVTSVNPASEFLDDLRAK
ncbi:MAG TPA: UvrD-helicase domain-containing protein [Anaerolineales bacterium]|nr:UvrD-helicase domain-containing protein [Anaerolineales bacterium]